MLSNNYRVLLAILIIGIAYVTFALGQNVENKKLKESIWKFEELADQNFANSHKKFEIYKIEKGKTIKETYLFSQNKNGFEKLVVEFAKGDLKEAEEYYFNNGKLVLAREIVYFKYENEWMDRWSVRLYIKDGKVFGQMSNGHGKTEDDEWVPKPLQMSKKRIKSLKNNLKKINY